MPAERSGGCRHQIDEPGGTQWRHRIFSLSAALKDVSLRVDLAVDVPGLAGHTDLVFNLVVIGFEFFQTEGPVFHRRTYGDSTGSIAALRLTNDFEIPRIEPPALSPVMERRSADCIHHGVNRRPRRVGSGRVWPMCRNLVIRFLHRLRPASEIVTKLIWGEVALSEPGACFETNHFEPGLG